MSAITAERSGRRLRQRRRHVGLGADAGAASPFGGLHIGLFVLILLGLRTCFATAGRETCRSP
jgi:hypothetical protein